MNTNNESDADVSADWPTSSEEQVSLDFFDQPGQVRLVKGNLGRGDAVTFYVWRHMLMVRKSASQGRIIRMWLRVVPVQPFPSLRHRIAIAADNASCEIQVLPCCQGNISIELDRSNELCESGAMSDDHQSRPPDRWISIRQAVDQQFIFRPRRQHQTRTSSGLGFSCIAGSSVACLSSETNEWLRASNSDSRSICIS